jgi:hypothetical protein
MGGLLKPRPCRFNSGTEIWWRWVYFNFLADHAIILFMSLLFCIIFLASDLYSLFFILG